MNQPESFISFIDAYGEARPPLMRYDGEEDFDTWQRKFRNAVTTLRGPLPDRVALEVETVDESDESDHVRKTVRIAVSEMSVLIAYVLVPKGIEEGERRPAVVASHGHTQAGIDTTCGVDVEGEEVKRAYGLEAVRAGYVVIAPSWWGWHGRDGHLDRVGGRDKCNVIQNAASMYGMNVTDLHIQDGQAAVDALCAMAEVDPERVGCLGNSYGGRTMMWLTVFERRIKACVAAGSMNTFRERSLKLSSCGIQYFPGILQYGDVPELFSLVAPRALQLQAGALDGLITPADRDAMVETVGRAYAKCGREDAFDYVLHPEGHFLKWEMAGPFLEKHL